ncbi:HAD family hydrolase [Herbidospora galbida]|uniref:HAD family hydrolase n=1 Tax=Herbidospora galbida TaxID=2575442 RepID=A0A4V5UZ49_9ACTN|nr:HAD family hydrolase [Herbidospora galbida]TKK87343.1 HAD family hydrolase [Herbidospora galbida]
MRTVTFDGDETLWDFQGAMQRALTVAAGLFGPPVTPEWLRRVRDDVAARPEFADAPMEDIRRAAFEECARLTGAGDGFAGRVHAEYMRARHAGVTLYPHTLPCLRELRSRGHRLALITNGNSRPDLIGVADFLACTVVADDLQPRGACRALVADAGSAGRQGERIFREEAAVVLQRHRIVEHDLL